MIVITLINQKPTAFKETSQAGLKNKKHSKEPVQNLFKKSTNKHYSFSQAICFSKLLGFFNKDLPTIQRPTLGKSFNSDHESKGFDQGATREVAAKITEQSTEIELTDPNALGKMEEEIQETIAYFNSDQFATDLAEGNVSAPSSSTTWDKPTT